MTTGEIENGEKGAGDNQKGTPLHTGNKSLRLHLPLHFKSRETTVFKMLFVYIGVLAVLTLFNVVFALLLRFIGYCDPITTAIGLLILVLAVLLIFRIVESVRSNTPYIHSPDPNTCAARLLEITSFLLFIIISVLDWIEVGRFIFDYDYLSKFETVCAVSYFATFVWTIMFWIIAVPVLTNFVTHTQAFQNIYERFEVEARERVVFTRRTGQGQMRTEVPVGGDLD